MDLIASQADSRGAPGTRPVSDAVAWQDIESGSYTADLPLWRALAAAAADPPGSRAILEVGAGAGRVALDLARLGHSVTAVDIEADLLLALRQRAAGLDLQTVCADARELELPGRRFALCVVALQTIQLFGGAAGRGRFLARARAHLTAGGILACAIVTDPEPFDGAAGDPLPAAETAELQGRLYSSCATAVRLGAERIAIERERRILDPEAPAGAAGATEVDLIELDLMTVESLQREAVEAGFTPLAVRTVDPTGEHVGSVVVVLGA